MDQPAAKHGDKAMKPDIQIILISRLEELASAPPRHALLGIVFAG